MDTVSAHADAVDRLYTNNKDMQGQQGKKKGQRQRARSTEKRGLRARYRAAILL